MKPSKAQLEVLRLMNSGWELAAKCGGRNSGAWIQEGGAGCGGKSKQISLATVHALWKKKLIEEAGGGPGLTDVYKLTAAGLAAPEAEVE